MISEIGLYLVFPGDCHSDRLLRVYESVQPATDEGPDTIYSACPYGNKHTSDILLCQSGVWEMKYRTQNSSTCFNVLGL